MQKKDLETWRKRQWKLPSQRNKEKTMKMREESLQELWDTMKRNKFSLWEFQKEMRDRKGKKVYLKQQWLKTSWTWVEKWTSRPRRPKGLQKGWNWIDLNQDTIIKLWKVKDKERFLRAARENRGVTYKGIFIRFLTDFSTETFQARREWDDILKILRKEKSQPRILYLAKLSFRNARGIRTFSDKQKQREFITIRPTLHER